MQEGLTGIGYNPGPIDGLLGANTRRAAGYFAGDHGISLPPLNRTNAADWCAAVQGVIYGAGVHAGRAPGVPSVMVENKERGCTEEPDAGFTHVLEHNVEGDPLHLRISSQFGGAVDSVVWRGKEFINIYDHGRQISYAWGLDGWGECLNPTEPGSAADMFAPDSTSRLLSVCSDTPNRVTTVTQPAYWLGPGETGFCDRGRKTAVNEELISDNLLTKTIELGYGGIDNVIAFDATIHIPQDRSFIQLEIPTAYLMEEFTAFWRYNPATKELMAQESQELQRPWSFLNTGLMPPIIATPDGEYAMGAYTAERIASYEILRYDVSNPQDRTSKWNIVRQERTAPAGDYRYLTFAVVGTLESVQEAMSELYRLHPVDFAPPTGYVDLINCSVIDGWAWDPKAASQPIAVEIYEVTDGVRNLLHRSVANRHRPDLVDALGDNGNHGFNIPTRLVLPDGKRRKLIFEAVNSGRGLPNAPMVPASMEIACPAFGE